jgi:hypothetical protein
MKTNRNIKKLLIFAMAAFMILSAVQIVSAVFFDFEANDGGWVPTADWDPVGDWEWTNTYNVANYIGSHTPPPSAYSGTGLWGTIIYDDYTNAGGTSYLSQTFDWSSVSPTNARLTFWEWVDVFGNFDYCNVFVNGVSEYYVDTYSPTAWHYVDLDLSAYAGLSSVTIEFAMYTTTVVEYAGWYIDDVDVAGTGPAPPDDGDPPCPCGRGGSGAPHRAHNPTEV